MTGNTDNKLQFVRTRTDSTRVSSITLQRIKGEIVGSEKTPAARLADYRWNDLEIIHDSREFRSSRHDRSNWSQYRNSPPSISRRTAFEPIRDTEKIRDSQRIWKHRAQLDYR